MDEFERVVQIESELWENGRAEAARDGMEQGYTEGYTLGLPRGLELGYELGEYLGAAQTWLNLLSSDTLRSTLIAESAESSLRRLKRSLESLVKMIEEFHFDPENDAFIDEFERIRAKYKQVTTMIQRHARIQLNTPKEPENVANGCKNCNGACDCFSTTNTGDNGSL